MDQNSKIENKNAAVIPLAWPFLTARAPEKIWHFLKKIGLVKNLNFRIGHAAILIVKANEILYYDLGRYISPLGYGRVRSKESDPKLSLSTLPKWNEKNEIENLNEICQELEDKKKATHGDGPLFASINYAVNIEKSLVYLRNLQKQGCHKYGALKKRNLNCGNLVAKAILAGLDSKSKIYKSLNNPITYSQTPYFNPLAVSSSGFYFICDNGNIEWKKAVKFDALKDMYYKALESFSSKKAKLLPSDEFVGQQAQPLSNPQNKTENWVYLGGIGEGAWHELTLNSETEVCMTRYDYNGVYEFKNTYEINSSCLADLISNNIQLIHDSHNLWITLQNKATNQKNRFFAINCPEEWKM